MCKSELEFFCWRWEDERIETEEDKWKKMVWKRSNQMAKEEDEKEEEK